MGLFGTFRDRRLALPGSALLMQPTFVSAERRIEDFRRRVVGSLLPQHNPELLRAMTDDPVSRLPRVVPPMLAGQRLAV